MGGLARGGCLFIQGDASNKRPPKLDGFLLQFGLGGIRA